MTAWDDSADYPSRHHDAHRPPNSDLPMTIVCRRRSACTSQTASCFSTMKLSSCLLLHSLVSERSVYAYLIACPRQLLLTPTPSTERFTMMLLIGGPASGDLAAWCSDLRRSWTCLLDGCGATRMPPAGQEVLRGGLTWHEDTFCHP